MPRRLNISSVKGRMPVRYRLHPLSRLPFLAISIAVAAWCLWVLFNRISSETPSFFRILPLVVLFIALDTAVRHLTNLNSVIFAPECLWLRFILRPSIAIPYERIQGMEFRKSITYYVYLKYTDARGRDRLFKTNASFPKMLEIMYNIADLCPQIQMNDELAKLVQVMQRIKDSERSESV
ncbi:MAG TPA: hypothetical protein PK802_05250 [Candidatus Cloacimonadota bacterium]|nr:hypothetical protein [Candidatus Cloacimonadota bacterium]HPB09076.1 hypothetical protein [Candidatus Cloacimonadota bacterium]HQL12990.1 hypothetical protein [Candidatus Cloacimonadota bacterium]HQO44306.1 hypothetical protein [Candidatus Cloacimonadota bacterium]HQP18194.1 hypothetical protein [Candidatus Cloacimonadota bacterium]